MAAPKSGKVGYVGFERDCPGKTWVACQHKRGKDDVPRSRKHPATLIGGGDASQPAVAR
jgi:hypothetical protein